jgi:hypothetical protein
MNKQHVKLTDNDREILTGKLSKETLSAKVRKRISGLLALDKGAGIEPVIGHLKTDRRLGRNFYKGVVGDMLAAAFNFKRMMNKWRIVPFSLFLPCPTAFTAHNTIPFFVPKSKGDLFFKERPYSGQYSKTLYGSYHGLLHKPAYQCRVFHF